MPKPKAETPDSPGQPNKPDPIAPIELGSTKVRKKPGPAKGHGGSQIGISIDFNLVVSLASVGCTDKEIATVIGMRHEHFCRRKIEVGTYEVRDHKTKRVTDTITMTLAEACEYGREGQLKTSLRRAQYEAAMRGNPTMLIWLGKQLLGQKDIVINEMVDPLTNGTNPRERLYSSIARQAASQARKGRSPKADR